jgi:hypothetical protein
MIKIKHDPILPMTSPQRGKSKADTRMGKVMQRVEWASSMRMTEGTFAQANVDIPPVLLVDVPVNCDEHSSQAAVPVT